MRRCSTVHFTVPGREIAFLRFILEAHDNLAVFSTIDRDKGLVRCMTPPEQLADLLDLLRALGHQPS